MKRTESILYQSDDNRTLVRIEGDKATVIPSSCTADELEQLSSACLAAAEELRAMVEEVEV